MKKRFRISFYSSLVLFLFLNSCQGQSQSNSLKEEISKRNINKVEIYINEIQKRYGVPGIALAIIKDGEVVYKKNTGYANLAHEVSISEKSIFRQYSLTKPIIAVGVFSLIEQDKIKLNDTIAKYVDGLPKEWRQIQVKHLLAHSSGLPDMGGDHPYDVRDLTEEQAKERVFAMPIRFQAGERFEYNQTNFWLIKTIIEIVTQESLSDFIIEHQFATASKTDVFFSADSRDIIKNRVTPYFPFEKGTIMADLPYTKGDYLFAAHSLHTTMDEFIKWDKKFNRNEFISNESKQKMWELFPYSNPEDQFSYGWGVSYLDQSPGYGFSGSLSTIYRNYPDDKLSIIYLSNGLSEYYDMGEVVIQIANLVQE